MLELFQNWIQIVFGSCCKLSEHQNIDPKNTFGLSNNQNDLHIFFFWYNAFESNEIHIGRDLLHCIHMLHIDSVYIEYLQCTVMCQINHFLLNSKDYLHASFPYTFIWSTRIDRQNRMIAYFNIYLSHKGGITCYRGHLSNYFRLHVCLSFCLLVRSFVRHTSQISAVSQIVTKSSLVCVKIRKYMFRSSLDL